MQTRHFLTLTLLVLALHLLLLGGLPLQMGGGGTPSAAAPLVFSTRSIPAPLASPEPPATSAETAPAATSQAAPAPTARKKPLRRKSAAPVAEPSAEPTDQAATAAQTQAQPDEAARAPADAEEAAQPGHAGQEAQEDEQGPADRLASAAKPPSDGAAGASMAASSTPVAAAAPVVSAAAASSPAAPMEAASTARAAASGSDSDSDAGLEILAPGAAADASAASRTPPPVRIPPPMRLEFDAQGLVKGLHYTTGAQLLWQHDGSRYQARQEVRVFLLGTRAQTSSGSITAQGLRPERFGDIARRELAAHFDYAQGRVIFSANTPQAPLRAGAQDRLSVFIQLGAMFAAQPQRFVPGTRISVPTIGPRSADRWVFAVRALETLHLPAGDMPAWRLERLPERDYDQKAELWLSPDFEYLPVRIRITQSNGDYVDLQLRSSGPP